MTATRLIFVIEFFPIYAIVYLLEYLGVSVIR